MYLRLTKIFVLFFTLFCSCKIERNEKLFPEKWGKGCENQRISDLGNGFYLNPILAGDYPDPTIMKDGDDYYMTHSSFDYVPGLLIWHSKDLINWEPVTAALKQYVGSVWAPDLTKHNGKYYIYFPGRIGNYRTNYVTMADSISGPWSEPVDLNLGRIDPGHIAGPDGQRYLFLSAGYMVPLSEDGLSVIGEPKKVYDGWQYPEDWVVESFSQEGPKMLKKGDYYYMILAEGGTAGPPTSHMVIAARSKSLDGPWENSPYNPITRTWKPDEKWWSKGHATLFEGPDSEWYMVYHGYENGYYNLGRQTLLEPVEWTQEDWFKAKKHFLADKATPVPAKSNIPHGFCFSDDFSTNKTGVQWRFYKEFDTTRFRFEDRTLILKGKGDSPKNSSPMAFVCGDQAYQLEVAIEVDDSTSGGLILFYNDRMYAGIGFNKSTLLMHRYGMDRILATPAAKKMFLRLINNHHIVTMYYSINGEEWQKFETQMDVSAYHHNVMYDFQSLRPALYAAGNGEVKFRNFTYKAIE